MKPILISICDYSGKWAEPWRDTHDIILIDPKHPRGVSKKREMHTYGGTAAEFLDHLVYNRYMARLWREDVDVILAAPPCTDFSGSGARWWAGKDKDGRTNASLQIVDECMTIINFLSPRVWALENPVGRLQRLLPKIGKPWYFHPCDYAGLADDPATEAYTKKTGIWGTAKKPEVGDHAVEPVMIEKRRKDGTIVRGSWMWANLGGKSERTKELRSNTPTGFARAFRAANGRDNA